MYRSRQRTWRAMTTWLAVILMTMNSAFGSGHLFSRMRACGSKPCGQQAVTCCVSPCETHCSSSAPQTSSRRRARGCFRQRVEQSQPSGCCGYDSMSTPTYSYESAGSDCWSGSVVMGSSYVGEVVYDGGYVDCGSVSSTCCSNDGYEVLSGDLYVESSDGGCSGTVVCESSCGCSDSSDCSGEVVVDGGCCGCSGSSGCSGCSGDVMTDGGEIMSDGCSSAGCADVEITEPAGEAVQTEDTDASDVPATTPADPVPTTKPDAPATPSSADAAGDEAAPTDDAPDDVDFDEDAYDEMGDLDDLPADPPALTEPADAADPALMEPADHPPELTEPADAIDSVDPVDPADPAEPPATDGGDESIDDLFGSSDQQPRVRRWQDNTGRFETVAQLSKINDTSVRLLKTNGRFCTVPLSRLSHGDFEYVQMQASRMGLSPLSRVASR